MKQKTRKSMAKRIKITKSGKILSVKIGRRHLLSNKSRKAKGLGKGGRMSEVVTPGFKKIFRKNLHIGANG